MKQPKAIALISGGLDSMLAAKTVMEQGVHIEGIHIWAITHPLLSAGDL
jgi:tRNA U34 2-thiouridine synthase MnmA/TrmU